MLKRNLIIIAIIGSALIFSANAFGQNNKRKANRLVTSLDGKGSDAILSKKPSGKTSKRKFQSQTQPFADGRSGGKKSKNSHNLLPYIKQNNRRKPKASSH
jgi:hypothetical protein